MSRFLSALCGVAAIIAIPVATAADVVAPGDVVIANLSVDKPLTNVPGDAASGKKIFANKKLGNCLACHANSDMADQQFHGEIGPSLDGAGTRWKEGQLRTLMVNAKAIFTEQTVMPGFYSLDVGADVRKDLIGKTILEAQQIEDLVAYLRTLK